MGELVKAHIHYAMQAIGGDGRLALAKHAFTGFWRLQPDVRQYFIDHATNPDQSDKQVCQTIELLCNAGGVAESVSLEQVKELVSVLDDASSLPDAAAKKISGYVGNKGGRGWKAPDRSLLVQAWRDA